MSLIGLNHVCFSLPMSFLFVTESESLEEFVRKGMNEWTDDEDIMYAVNDYLYEYNNTFIENGAVKARLPVIQNFYDILERLVLFVIFYSIFVQYVYSH